MSEKNKKLLVGWCEWAALPRLRIPNIKAKIDTGAKTSALHAFNVKPFWENDLPYVSFSVHPSLRPGKSNVCSSRIVDQRYIRSSNGQKDLRFVIETTLVIGKRRKKIQLTLSNRSSLRYQLLIGREAMQDYIIEPKRSYILGKHRSTA